MELRPRARVELRYYVVVFFTVKAICMLQLDLMESAPLRLN